MRVLVVTAAESELTDVATACHATPVDRADRQAGYLRPEQLGSCERWVSTPKASHVITSAEVPQSA